MNRARLRELGFELGVRAEAGVSDEGAWFATAPDCAPVVLKWFPDETVAERYAVLLPGLDTGIIDWEGACAGDPRFEGTWPAFRYCSWTVREVDRCSCCSTKRARILARARAPNNAHVLSRRMSTSLPASRHIGLKFPEV